MSVTDCPEIITSSLCTHRPATTFNHCPAHAHPDLEQISCARRQMTDHAIHTRSHTRSASGLTTLSSTTPSNACLTTKIHTYLAIGRERCSRELGDCGHAVVLIGAHVNPPQGILSCLTKGNFSLTCGLLAQYGCHKACRNRYRSYTAILGYNFEGSLKWSCRGR